MIELLQILCIKLGVCKYPGFWSQNPDLLGFRVFAGFWVFWIFGGFLVSPPMGYVYALSKATPKKKPTKTKKPVGHKNQEWLTLVKLDSKMFKFWFFQDPSALEMDGPRIVRWPHFLNPNWCLDVWGHSLGNIQSGSSSIFRIIVWSTIPKSVWEKYSTGTTNSCNSWNVRVKKLRSFIEYLVEF